jgi:hypothetical protein
VPPTFAALTGGFFTRRLTFKNVCRSLSARVEDRRRSGLQPSPGVCVIYTTPITLTSNRLDQHLRGRDSNGDGTLDERLYVVQDANYNVTALFDNSGNIVERYVYDLAFDTQFSCETEVTSSNATPTTRSAR